MRSNITASLVGTEYGRSPNGLQTSWTLRSQRGSGSFECGLPILDADPDQRHVGYQLGVDGQVVGRDGKVRRRPTLGTWPASVTHTDEVCTSTKSAKGTISVDTAEGDISTT